MPIYSTREKEKKTLKECAFFIALFQINLLFDDIIFVMLFYITPYTYGLFGVRYS